MEQFFISDLHLGHEKVIKFDNRPFSSIEDHDNTIVKRWNEKVSSDDSVYILGDVSWHPVNKTIELIGGLKGHKFLIVGNHDGKLLKDYNFKKLFDGIYDYKELYVNRTTAIVLCHYPITCYKNHYYGWYHFYGHVHNSFEGDMVEKFQQEMRKLGKPSEMYNVGCMMPYVNYTPQSFEEIKEKAEYNNACFR